MARSPRKRAPRIEGRIRCRLWDDPVWRLLSDAEKTTYLQVATSPGLSTCGTSTLSLPHLAASRVSSEDEAMLMAREKEIGDDLAALTSRGFVHVDHVTEEVLVCGFVTRYGLGHTWQQLVRIERDWAAILSTTIRSLVLDDIKESIPSPLPVAWLSRLDPGFVAQIGDVCVEALRGDVI